MRLRKNNQFNSFNYNNLEDNMFWNIFVKLCMEKNKSPTAIGTELGFSRATVSNWKTGGAPRETALLKIANYFNVSVDYLLGNTDETPTKKLPKTNTKRIPVVGDVAAGIPIEAIEEWDDWEEIDKRKFTAAEYIALKIHGDSMEPEIKNGDIVIIECENPCKTGDYAIVLINGSEATCKKIQFMPDGIRLISLNPEYGPMFFTKKQIEELPVRIFGKVVEIRRTI